MNFTLEQISARLAARNPFAIRRRWSFQFADDTSVSGLIERLKDNQWTGEIVGPTGSGKTTLVHTLVPFLEQAGRNVKILNVRPNESRLPIAGNDLQAWGPSTQVVVDGFEQLGNWTRTLLSRICRTQCCGLLRVSCEPTGDTLLYRTHCSLQLTQRLVQEIQSTAEPRVSDGDVAISYERHRGNVREVLNDLHNIYERRCG